MFERYDEKSRRVIFFSRYEASTFGSPYIEPHHILLGLMREDRVFIARFIKSEEFETIRRSIEEMFPPAGARIATSVDLPFSLESNRALALAAEEAEQMKHELILPGHLLLGLIRVKESGAGKVLHDYGIEIEAVRAEVGSRNNPGLCWRI